MSARSISFTGAVTLAFMVGLGCSEAADDPSEPLNQPLPTPQPSSIEPGPAQSGPGVPASPGAVGPIGGPGTGAGPVDLSPTPAAGSGPQPALPPVTPVNTDDSTSGVVPQPNVPSAPNAQPSTQPEPGPDNPSPVTDPSGTPSDSTQPETAPTPSEPTPSPTDSTDSTSTTDDTTSGAAPTGEPEPAPTPTPQPSGPVIADTSCARSTGLGKGSSTEYPCAALDDGGVACFTEQTATFLVYQGGAPITDAVMATGNAFSPSGCLINTNGAVHCWDNTEVSTTPVIAAGALEVTGGQGKNCALVDGSPRTVQCWTGSSGSAATVSLSAEPTMVSCGYSECCATTVAGTIECWGSPTGAPSTVNASFGAEWVGTGQQEKCAVDGDGAAYCWGENWNGQLGLPDMLAQAEPVVATFESGVVATASGQFHSCFLFADGTVQCSGKDQVNGAGGGGSTPSPIAGLTDAIALSVAKHASCAAKRDGEVVCWGDNSGGVTPVTITANGAPIRVRVPDVCR